MESKVFMAFATGKESVESSVIKRYIGVAPVQVLAVNPNKAALEKIFNNEVKEEPVYVKEIENGDNKVLQSRIEFLVKTVEEPEIITRITYFINKEYRFNKDKSKVQVIDKYGATTWLSLEDAKNKVVPSNMTWFDNDFRPCYRGEEELTSFIKTFLNIPNKTYKNSTTGEIVEIPNKQDAEARLDGIDKIFTGDFSEIDSAIKYQPNNKVKVMFGVRTTDEGKMYQTVYNSLILRNKATNYEPLKKSLDEKKEFGMYATTEFDICPLKEYTVNSTNFSEPQSSPTATASAASDDFWGPAPF